MQMERGEAGACGTPTISLLLWVLQVLLHRLDSIPLLRVLVRANHNLGKGTVPDELADFIRVQEVHIQAPSQLLVC